MCPMIVGNGAIRESFPKDLVATSDRESWNLPGKDGR